MKVTQGSRLTRSANLSSNSRRCLVGGGPCMSPDVASQAQLYRCLHLPSYLIPLSHLWEMPGPVITQHQAAEFCSLLEPQVQKYAELFIWPFPEPLKFSVHWIVSIFLLNILKLWWRLALFEMKWLSFWQGHHLIWPHGFGIDGLLVEDTNSCCCCTFYFAHLSQAQTAVRWKSSAKRLVMCSGVVL